MNTASSPVHIDCLVFQKCNTYNTVCAIMFNAKEFTHHETRSGLFTMGMHVDINYYASFKKFFGHL